MKSPFTPGLTAAMAMLLWLLLLASCDSNKTKCNLDEGDGVDDTCLSDSLGIQELKSAKLRDTNPDVSGDETSQLADGLNDFALNLYRKAVAATPGDGMMLSPYSIYNALAMTLAGARNDTATQMRDAMQISLADARLDPAMNGLGLALDELNHAQNQESEIHFRLNVANSIWVQQDYPIVSAYLDTLAVNYEAGMKALDFAENPEEARQKINDWVSGKTEDRINDLLPQGSVTDMTRLVLTNAVYFLGGWEYEFDKENTEDAAFHLLDGNQTTVSTMKLEKTLMYSEGDGFKAVRLPYQGNDSSMLLILPDEGQFSTVEAALSSVVLRSVDETAEGALVTLKLPKFKQESSFSLVDVLKALGMTEAFSDSADFSGITHTEKILISDMIHKTYINVDEKGTEAAAATAIIMIGAADGDEPRQVDMTLDRPFLYAIRHDDSGALLFLGRVLKP